MRKRGVVGFGIESAVIEARAGTLDFAGFYERTTADWARIARQLLRKWEVPIWLSPEDIEHDLVIAAWLAVHKYTPKRGKMSLKGFVVWRAYAAAKRVIHKARLGHRPHRGESRAKSQHELFANDIASRPGEPEVNGVDVLASVEATQELAAFRCSILRRFIPLSRTTSDALALRALVAVGGRSIDDAAAVLYDDEDARLTCRLLNEEHAGKVVMNAVAYAAQNSL